MGRGAHLQHDRHAARLVHLAPARLGRARSSSFTAKAAASRSPTARFSTASSSSSASTPPTSGTNRPPRNCCRQGRTCAKCGGARVPQGDRHSRRLVRLRIEPPRGAQRALRICPGPPTCTWRAATSIAAGSTAPCWSAPGCKGCCAVPRLRAQRLGARWRGQGDAQVARQRHRAGGGDQEARRGDAAPVVRLGGFQRGRAHVGDHPDAARGRLSQAAEHVPLSCWATSRTSIRPKDAVPADELAEFDQWILLRAEDLVARCRAWYDNFEFHKVYHTVYAFATVDLSVDLLRRAEGPALHVGHRNRRRAAARRPRSTACSTPWCACWRPS